METNYINRVIKTDCVEGINKLISRGISVDLIIADPPYVISRESNFHTMKDRKNARTGTSFGEWDEAFDNAKWIEASFGALKDGGALIVFNDFKKVSEIIAIAAKFGFEFKDVIIWEKTNPMPRNRDRRYVPSLELMIWFVKRIKRKWTFNRQEATYQSPIMKYPSESGGAFKRYHPTQKPVKLIEKIIEIHSFEGELILDPFMGSGTTAIAALNASRKFVGFEIDEKFYDILTSRIARHTAALFSRDEIGA
ncbi:MAG: site-specific DNA-methyltransferase [Helicobacteraceae bacterium]|jgi:DNA modification methylase|nr:site-specific DNA-methyltransferase [Helicobacteraceae bacterium]